MVGDRRGSVWEGKGNLDVEVLILILILIFWLVVVCNVCVVRVLMGDGRWEGAESGNPKVTWMYISLVVCLSGSDLFLGWLLWVGDGRRRERREMRRSPEMEWNGK
jgi:hypothetical protein